MATPEPKLRDFFSKAVQYQNAQEQAAYLEQVCQGDADLRARLEDLLQAQREIGSFLQEPSASRGDTVDEPPISERPGTVIGQYKLLQQIGEGGMGTVFMAEQQQPVRRKVALKVIKPGMDSRQVIARFEAERQALAMMDHVNIARVLDGGEAPPAYAGGSPRPYFVMELVHGVPITKYCDANQLTPRQRLELFVPVCRAIQHAHQKGIIHRDIKPSNVMITLSDGKPLPKVIDFGVAKATEQKLTAQTLFTQYGTMLGTLEYMSPEQAEMSAQGADTRSDIFSLGVLLYELLTGSTPLSQKRLKEAAYAEILRLIKEEEPPKPSTRLSDSGKALASISAQRHMEPDKLTRLVRGELDWIVLKALEKDRNRRYETATGFAADVQRYLNDEPVQACPASAGYRLRKFVRRNKGPVLAGAALVGLLVAGTAVSAWQAVRATRATETADQQRQRAQGNLQIALKALDGIYLQVAEERLPRDPQRKKEDTELLKKALDFYQQFAQQNSAAPSVRAEVSRAYRRVGDIQGFVGEHAAAQEAYGLAIARAQELATEIPAVPDYLHELAVCHTSLAEALALTGQMVAATEHYRQSIDLLTKLTADYPAVAQYRAELARSHHGLGKLHKRQGERGAAEESFRQALDIQSKVNADFPSVPEYRADLAQIHRLLGYWPEGSQWLPIIPEQVDHLRQACKILNDLVAEFPAIALYRYRLASTLQELATYAWPFTERNEFYNQAIPILTKLAADFSQVPEYRSALSVCYGNHGFNCLTFGDWEMAAKYWRMSLDLSTKLAAECPSVTHFSGQLAVGLVNWAEILICRGELAEARKSLEDAITRLQGCLKAQPNSPYYAQMLTIANYLLSCAIAPLGEAVEAAKRQQDADQVLVETGKRLLKARGPSIAATFSADVATGLGTVIEGLKKKGRHQELTTIYGAAIKALSKAIEFDPTFANAWTNRGVAYANLGQLDKAVADYSKAIEVKPDYAVARNALSRVLATRADDKLRDPHRAVKHAKKAVELAPKEGDYWNTLGMVHYRAGDWKAAFAALEKSMELRSGGDGSDWFFLAMAYRQLGKPEQARQWYEQACKWTDKNKPADEELKSLRSEAATLLAMIKPPLAEVPPKKN